MKNLTIQRKFKFVIYLLLTFTIQLFSQTVKQNLRAPAYPLITIDPYTSIWSMNDNLNDDVTRHWTGTRQSLIGALRVDGKVYRFMGKEELPLKTILPMADKKAWKCKYTFDEPNDNWGSKNFDDSKWLSGKAAFGTNDSPFLNTLWESDHIWVRREFSLEKILTDKKLYLIYSHDDDVDIYLNGKKIIATGDACFKDVLFPLEGDLRNLLNENGNNIIAAHCYNRVGLAYLDFGIFQEQDLDEVFINKAVQKSVELTATQTKYNFECGGVNLKLTFTSPLLPENLNILSRPINYITYDVISNDGKEHDVQIYFESTPELAVDKIQQNVTLTKYVNNNLTFLKVGSTDQNILGKKGDNVRIDWGYLYLTGAQQLSIGRYSELKKQFMNSGNIKNNIENASSIMEDEMMVAANCDNIGKVSQNERSGYFMIGYDDINSIQYFTRNLKAWWKEEGNVTIEKAFSLAADEYAKIIKNCDSFDRELYKNSVESGGKEYAELCILAFRQSIAAHKLTKSKDGEILFLSKENFSNGSIGTVDVTYPSAPLFLYYNPELLKGMLNPIFYYNESGNWKKPFAPHDVGTYPIANGQTYGGDMPVEECGNILILTAAIAQVEKNADYANKHWSTLTAWANYLLENGLDPENQLCTDDFAGHFAHNTNLSIKAIMGIASYGKLANMIGKNDIGKKYLSEGKEMAVKWERMANDGDHYKLTFDKNNTWSQKYNLVWDKILGTNIFNENISSKEINYYLTRQNEYGLPLDNRKTYTKSDWIIWTSTLSEDKNKFQELVHPLYKFVNETSDRVPMTDWYDTITAKQVGFQSRSVVGGYFIKILKDKILSQK